MSSAETTGTPDRTRAAAPGPRREALRQCRDCGLPQVLPALPRGGVATCRRCDAVLRRARSEPFLRPLALAVAGLILFSIAATAPFMSLDLLGRTWTATLPALPADLERFGQWELAPVVLATTLIVPLARLCLTIAVLGVLRRPGVMPGWLPAAARWRERLGPWAMVDVFLLGAFVAYTRLIAMATVHIGPALWAMGALMFAKVASDALLDRDAMWQEIARRRAAWRAHATSAAPHDAPPPNATAASASPVAASHPAAPAPIGCHECGRVARVAPGRSCPCCGAVLHPRKPNSLARTWALLLAATLLYIPANLYPILTLVRSGVTYRSTILGGVHELIEAQMWPLALLVFVASVLVPVLKLVGLAVLLVTTARRSTWRLPDRTRLYRVVDVIGRWSMVDIFMLAVLVALVQAGLLSTVLPEPGAVYFAAVVVLTMLASHCFDPRLMWDAADPAPRHARSHRLPDARPEAFGDRTA